MLPRLVRLPVLKQGAPPTEVPRPTPGEVIYADPNPDGSRKSCSNCMMWVKDNQCLIHEKGLKVPANMVCGYHVYGKPMDKWMDHPGMMPVKPETSGLIVAIYGTTCNICLWFDVGTPDSDTLNQEEGGFCLAVKHTEEEDIDAEIAGFGCCSRWVENAEAMEGLSPIVVEGGEEPEEEAPAE